MIHFSQLLCRSWHLDAKIWACNCLFPTYHWSLTLNRAEGVHAHLTEHVRKHEFLPPYCWFQTNTTVFAFLFIVTFLFFWTLGNLGSLIRVSIWSIPLSHQSPISYFLNGLRLHLLPLWSQTPSAARASSWAGLYSMVSHECPLV